MTSQVVNIVVAIVCHCLFVIGKSEQTYIFLNHKVGTFLLYSLTRLPTHSYILTHTYTQTHTRLGYVQHVDHESAGLQVKSCKRENITVQKQARAILERVLLHDGTAG